MGSQRLVSLFGLLQYWFVRDDILRAMVCRQIALAIRDEVADLEAAGIAVIQVDKPQVSESDH